MHISTAPILATLLLASGAAAQGAWIQLQPSTSPPARAMGGLAAMLQQNKCVLFGGEVNVNSTTLNDTWTWDGSNWTQLQVTGPQPLEGFVMEYDLLRDRVVLFSGWNGNIYVQETWEFDGANWTQMTPAVTPPGRDWHGGAYDPIRGNLVIFGGHDWQAAGGSLADTWTWDGTTWTNQAVTGPSARWGHSMVFDPNTNTVIMFGGTGAGNETWSWDGTAWTQLTPATTPPSRKWHQLIWDPNRGRVVMVAGEWSGTLLNDVWEWDGTDWSQPTVTGTPPAATYLTGADFDPVQGQIVQFGGGDVAGRNSSNDETWLLVDNAQGFATVDSYGSGCGGVSNFASYYEQFPAGTFDLGGAPGAENAIRQNFISSGYLVLPGQSAWFTPVSGDLGLGDDALSGALSLGFTMTLPSGAQTSAVYACSNGFIWLVTAGNTDFSPSVSEFLGQGERLAPYWTDLNPTTGGSIHFDTDPANNVAYITYMGVNEYSGGGNVTMQVALYATGDIEIRYGAETMGATGTQSAIVGFTHGNGALDPGSSDLSTIGTTPIITQPDQFVLDFGMRSTRPVEGTTMSVFLDNIPPSSLFGAFAVSGSQVFPGIQPIPGLDNCFQYIGSLDPFYFLPSVPSQTLTVGVPIGTFTGVSFYAQTIMLAPGVTPSGVVSTNGLHWVVNVN